MSLGKSLNSAFNKYSDSRVGAFFRKPSVHGAELVFGVLALSVATTPLLAVGGATIVVGGTINLGLDAYTAVKAHQKKPKNGL